MKQMTLCFLRLMEIINSKQNCIHHQEALRRLIVNFGSVYSVAEEGLMKSEADAFTYSLHLCLNKIYGEKMGRT